jgi:hypothetical protein
VVVFARAYSRLTKAKAQTVAYRNAANCEQTTHPAMPIADYPQDELTQELQKLNGRLRPGSTLVSFLQQQKNPALRDEMAQRLREKVWWCEGEESEEGECDADFEVDPELDPESVPSQDDADIRLAQLRPPHLVAAKAAAAKAATEKAAVEGNHSEASIVYISDEETDKAKNVELPVQ